MQGIDFEHVRDSLINVLESRFKMKQDFERVDKDFNDLENFNKRFEAEFG